MRLFFILITSLSFAWGASASAQSDKPVVGIYQMEDLADTGQSDTFSAMIETAVASSGKFRVMERSQMSRLLQEQGRARGGLVTTNTPGRTGGFEGVDYLIYGSITSVAASREANIGAAFIGGLLGSRNSSSCSNAQVRLEADIKITDANTGEVRYVTRIAETQKSATSCSGDSNIDFAALMRSAADSVATGLVTAIYPIQVAAVQPDGLVILNYGQGAVSSGDFLNVYQQGEPIRDPTTGEIIATNETLLGTIEIVDVQSRVSRGRQISRFQHAPAIGAVARPASQAEAEALKKARKRR